MLKSSLKNKALRKRASQFTKLVRHSAVTPRTGKTHKAKLASNGELGVTFIGHSSFFLQIGGQNVVIDPNFARWLFVLKRLRQPGLNLRDLPPMDVVLVTHAHFDHLHRQSLRTIARQTRRQAGTAPTLVVPHHLFDLVSDLGFEQIVELEWWNTYRYQSRSIAPLGSPYPERFTPRLWWLRVAQRQTLCLPRWRHRLLQRLPRDRTPLVASNSATAHRRLQPRTVPQRSHQPRRCHQSVCRSQVAMDDPHALRHLPTLP